MALLLVVELGLVAIWLPRALGGVLSGIALEFVTGREAAFPVALGAGAPPLVVASASVLQNLAVAALVAPLASSLLDRWRSHNHFLARRLRNLERYAVRHETYVRRWGPLGLFAFMLVPFLANGALVSSVLGRISGIPLRNIAAPVVSATVLVAFAWAYFYDAILTGLGRLDSRIPALAASLMVAGVLAWAAVDEIRDRRRG